MTTNTTERMREDFSAEIEHILLAFRRGMYESDAEALTEKEMTTNTNITGGSDE